jgi:hypothetical protein
MAHASSPGACGGGCMGAPPAAGCAGPSTPASGGMPTAAPALGPYKKGLGTCVSVRARCMRCGLGGGLLYAPPPAPKAT